MSNKTLIKLLLLVDIVRFKAFKLQSIFLTMEKTPDWGQWVVAQYNATATGTYLTVVFFFVGYEVARQIFKNCTLMTFAYIVFEV